MSDFSVSSIDIDHQIVLYFIAFSRRLWMSIIACSGAIMRFTSQRVFTLTLIDFSFILSASTFVCSERTSPILQDIFFGPFSRLESSTSVVMRLSACLIAFCAWWISSFPFCVLLKSCKFPFAIARGVLSSCPASWMKASISSIFLRIGLSILRMRDELTRANGNIKIKFTKRK